MYASPTRVFFQALSHMKLTHDSYWGNEIWQQIGWEDRQHTFFDAEDE